MINHFLRYEAVAREVEAVPGRSLLEVGGGSRGVGPWISNRWEITNCDLTFDDYGSTNAATTSRASRVQGSVLELPFEADAFDVVIALDLLEHVSADDRAQALAELARVAGGRAVVGCPCGPLALHVDRALRHFLVWRHKAVPGWLDEHLQNGFPTPVELEKPLAHLGKLDVVHNTNVLARLLVAAAETMPRLNHYLMRIFARAAPGVRGRGVRRRRAAAIAKLMRGLDLPPVYRRVVILTKPQEHSLGP